MTIAVGILANDGVVVAADTEETAGYMKYPTQKIITSEDGDGYKTPVRGACAIAGAGHAGYIDALSQTLAFQFRDKPTLRGMRLLDAIRKTVRDFHVSTIAPFNYAGHERPAVELLIGLQRAGQLALYGTDGPATRVGFQFTAVGLGAPFAQTLLERYWVPTGSLREAQIVAAYVVYRTKESVPGCGKHTSLVTLHRTPRVASDPIEHMSWFQLDWLEKLFGSALYREEIRTFWGFVTAHCEQLDHSFKEQAESLSRVELEVPKPPKRGRKRRPPSPE